MPALSPYWNYEADPIVVVHYCVYVASDFERSNEVPTPSCAPAAAAESVSATASSKPADTRPNALISAILFQRKNKSAEFGTWTVCRRILSSSLQIFFFFSHTPAPQQQRDSIMSVAFDLARRSEEHTSELPSLM